MQCPHCGRLVKIELVRNETLFITNQVLALADAPPDGRTIHDPNPEPQMNPGNYGAKPDPRLVQNIDIYEVAPMAPIEIKTDGAMRWATETKQGG